MSCGDLLRNISVLFVEDEKKLSLLLKDAIGTKFKEFILAADGREGLKKAEEHQPDIVITDITMPYMNGLKMSELIREKKPDLPIVILSAYSEKDYLLEAIDVGVTKYLIKPFDPDDLLDIICKLAKGLKKLHTVPLLPPFYYDLKSGKLFRDHSMVRLSKRENLFLRSLIESPNFFMTPDQIKNTLWDEDEVSDERLRVFINRFRSKTDPKLIGNIVGQGYVLNARGSDKGE